MRPFHAAICTAKRHRLLGATLGVLGWITATYANAGPITSEGDCPRAEAVWGALEGAIAPAEAARIVAQGRLLGHVRDEGASFTVRGTGVHRPFADPQRDCDSRARQAAVFLALSLADAAPPKVAAPPTAAFDHWRVEASMLADAAPAVGLGWGARLALSGTAAKNVRWMVDVLGARIGDGAVKGLAIRSDRAAVQAGAELGTRRYTFEAALQLLASVSWMSWQSIMVPQPASDAVVVGSAVLQGRLAWGRGRWRPFALLGLEWFPRPSLVRLEPNIRLETPALRIQPQIGISVTIP